MKFQAPSKKQGCSLKGSLAGLVAVQDTDGHGTHQRMLWAPDCGEMTAPGSCASQPWRKAAEPAREQILQGLLLHWDWSPQGTEGTGIFVLWSHGTEPAVASSSCITSTDSDTKLSVSCKGKETQRSKHSIWKVNSNIQLPACSHVLQTAPCNVIGSWKTKLLYCWGYDEKAEDKKWPPKGNFGSTAWTQTSTWSFKKSFRLRPWRSWWYLLAGTSQPFGDLEYASCWN